jgi:peptide/nickel transport system permease protein
MFRYIVRRLLFAIPTLIAISFIVFAILDLAPNDPTGNLPLTIPPEVREQIRQSPGLGEPFHIRYVKWAEQFFINEPLNVLEQTTGLKVGDERLRIAVDIPARIFGSVSVTASPSARSMRVSGACRNAISARYPS